MLNLKLILFLSIIFCIGLVTITYYQDNNVHASVRSNTTNETTTNETQPHFTKYSDTRLGVSFEYPSDWLLNDKINRFAKNSDVTVYNGSNSFRVMKSQSSSDSALVEKLGGPKEIVEIILPSEERVVGQIDENKYIIDGINAISVLTAREGITDVPNKGFERFLLMHDDSLYIFTYQDTVERFDTKESQDTLNHILKTIRFIDSDSDSNSSGVNDSENEDDDNGDDANN
jgi:PsbP-like protein